MFSSLRSAHRSKNKTESIRYIAYVRSATCRYRRAAGALTLTLA